MTVEPKARTSEELDELVIRVRKPREFLESAVSSWVVRVLYEDIDQLIAMARRSLVNSDE